MVLTHDFHTTTRKTIRAGTEVRCITNHPRAEGASYAILTDLEGRTFFQNGLYEGTVNATVERPKL